MGGKKLKICNLYCGIGGNRKYWDKEHMGEDHEIVAVELNPQIAKIYQDFFPNDTVIVADAHQYLLEHFKEFEFIWSSPPCPTHSRVRFMASKHGSYPPVYPDMKLYEEIIFLNHFFKGKYVVENVIPYYDFRSLYEPAMNPQKISRHCFWANFPIRQIEVEKRHTKHNKITGKTELYGFNLAGKDCGTRKDQVIRNCVNPELGLHILNESKREVQPELFK